MKPSNNEVPDSKRTERTFRIFFVVMFILGCLQPIASLLDLRNFERVSRALNVSSSSAPFTKIGKTDFLDLSEPEKVIFTKNDGGEQTFTFQDILKEWNAPHFVHISGIYPLYLYLDFPNSRTEKYLKFRICNLVDDAKSFRVYFPLKKGTREYELSCSK